MHRTTFHSISLITVTRGLLALTLVWAGMSAGCTRKCRTGTVLEGGLCRSPGSATPQTGDQAGPSQAERAPEGIDAGALDRGSAKSMGASAATTSTAGVSGGAQAGSGPSATTTTASAGSGAAIATPGQGAIPGDGQSGNTQGGLCGNNVIDPGETCDPIPSCPTAATCKSSDPCLVGALTGDPTTCTSECQLNEVSECSSGDLCCPKGCTHSKDDDCSQACGDGELAESESCEPMNSQYPCPVSCDDQEACTMDLMTGSPEQCNVKCTNMPITAPRSGDGCCPPNADANSDSDCDPRCGNGVVEAGEICDGNCPSSCDDRDECTVDKQTGSASACNIKCEHTDSTTAECLCGNGRKDSNETCDDTSSSRCPTTCAKPNECTEARMEGDSRTCDVRCTTAPITAPRDNDDCCPRNANANTDNDCRATCGNGVKEDGEDCDGRDCPTICPNNGDLCLEETKPVISNCRVICSATKVSNCGQYTACNTSADCASGFACGGFGVCQGTQSCQNSTVEQDCPTVDGRKKTCESAYCVAECTTQRDCPPHTVCTNGDFNTNYCRKG